MSINKLAEAIRNMRTARGLTQQELADMIEMHPGSIAQIEQGKRSVSVDTLNKIADAFQIPAACLVVLGSSPSDKNKAVDELLVAMQGLVSNLIDAKVVLSGDGRRRTSAGKPAVPTDKAWVSARKYTRKKSPRRKQLQHS